MPFTRPQLERYADVLIWGLTVARKKPFKPYDLILVRYDLEALPLLETLYARLIAQRRNVVVRAMPGPSMEKSFFSLSDAAQRRFLAPFDMDLYARISGNIYLHAPSSLTHLKSIDTQRINEFTISRKPLRDIANKREDAGAFTWTLCTYPTRALADQAQLSLREYAAQVAKACFLGDRDPVGRWNRIYADVNGIKKRLNALPIESVTVESASCDLTIRFGEKRRFIGVSGRNIPSFEIFTSPDWREARGVYFADQASFRNGNYVEGVRLEFQKGRVVRVSAKKGGAFVKKTLSMDRGASQIGEFSLTDRRFSKIDRFMADTLFDENFGGRHGNCHIALGSSYADAFAGDPATLTKSAKASLGFNDSALHWDLVNTEKKRVTAALRGGGKAVIYENGMFAV